MSWREAWKDWNGLCWISPGEIGNAVLGKITSKGQRCRRKENSKIEMGVGRNGNWRKEMYTKLYNYVFVQNQHSGNIAPEKLFEKNWEKLIRT